MSDIKDEDKERKQNLKNLFADRLDDLVEEKKESTKTSNKEIAEGIQISESQLSC